VINYLKATGRQLGLLVNFGHDPKIEHERFVNLPFSHISRISSFQQSGGQQVDAVDARASRH
jgi:hypothetical protein